jgi:imidazolonepropionase-like amidohydrolase
VILIHQKINSLLRVLFEFIVAGEIITCLFYWIILYFLPSTTHETMIKKLILYCLMLLFAGPSDLMAQKTILHCGELLDIRTGKINKTMSVVIDGQRIEKIEKGFIDGGKDDQLVDLKTKVVLPGLIDLHVHLENETSPQAYINRFVLNDTDVAFRSTSYARKTLMAGFTTVRDVGGTGVNIALRNAINNGLVDGPRIFTAGKAIGTTGGHADPSNGMRFDFMGDPGPRNGVVNGPDDARKAVRQRYKDGADLIKITATGGVLSVAKNGQNPQFFPDELESIIETANDYGFHVAAHAHGKEGMKRAVLAGVKTIEHGTLMDEEVMQLMIEKGTYYVPTISAGIYVAEKAKEPGYYPEIVRPKAAEIGPQLQNTFREANKAGVKIAFGTDAAVFPHGDNAKEFVYMTEVGMPTLEALQSATLVAAEVLNIADRTGAIEAGMMADIIAVDEDPLKNIEILQSVDFVMKDGQIYKQP